jgi:predicted phage baseplate assembly protein
VNATAAAAPEIALVATDAQGFERPWLWQRWLLGSGPADHAFTVTPERYAAVGSGHSQTWFDYDGEGTTIRFGDGTFGLTPDPGTVFTVTYLSGGGTTGNVPADTIVEVDSGQPQRIDVVSVTNPFAALGGADPETAQQVRDRAPRAFAAKPLRVVRSEDYVAAAQSLDWVMQAGTAFRWTGSWLTALTTADPRHRPDVTIAQLEQLSDLLNRRRLAGYESYVLAPRYTSIDLRITVCAQPTAFAADVKAAVLEVLRPGAMPDGRTGFFDHDRWSFGQALEASALLAAIQRAHGVLGVTDVTYRRRGLQPDWAALPDTLAIAGDRILRVDDDPSHPENGSLQVTVEGGR